jgi:hypothetical protein
MDVVRIFWVINFFFFLLVLIFLWSKMYLITKKINDLLSIIKQSNDLGHSDTMKEQQLTTGVAGRKQGQ